jgi:hypothetical protein
MHLEPEQQLTALHFAENGHLAPGTGSKQSDITQPTGMWTALAGVIHLAPKLGRLFFTSTFGAWAHKRRMRHAPARRVLKRVQEL